MPSIRYTHCDIVAVLLSGIVEAVMRPVSWLCSIAIGMIALCACPILSAQSNQEWMAYKRACGLRSDLDYQTWTQQGSPCPARNSGNSNGDNGAAARAAEADAAARRQREAEIERQRIDAENERQRAEAERQAKFEHDKGEALGELKGIAGGSDFTSPSGLKHIDPINSGLKDATVSDSSGLKTLTERHYKPAGNGLILGLGAIVYAHRESGEPAQRMCDAIKQQARVAHKDYGAGADCNRYNFVLGMASSLDLYTDLWNRVAFDDLANGRFSAQEQLLYEKLRGKQFDELGCHSNGAMLCLAALENEDIQADQVVLYGPQVTRESLQMWNKLVQDRRVKSVKIYLNENDPVPGAAIAFADVLKSQPAAGASLKSYPTADNAAVHGATATAVMATDTGLFQVESLKRTINETSPRLLVQTFPCKLAMSTGGCHVMSMYRSKVNCTGKSSGNSVPGTALRGKDDLPEPPLPCGAIGAAQR
jgi:hypothetical protein